MGDRRSAPRNKMLDAKRLLVALIVVMVMANLVRMHAANPEPAISGTHSSSQGLFMEHRAPDGRPREPLPVSHATPFIPASDCAADALLLDSSPDEQRAAWSDGQPHYLVYAPQFGLSNQLVALHNAVAWAQLLNRTLVLPHLLAHGAVYPRAAFGGAFDGARASEGISPVRVVEMDEFLHEGLRPAGQIVLNTTNKFRAASDAYFDSLDASWGRRSAS